jgi:hypothetical protein
MAIKDTGYNLSLEGLTTFLKADSLSYQKQTKILEDASDDKRLLADLTHLSSELVKAQTSNQDKIDLTKSLDMIDRVRRITPDALISTNAKWNSASQIKAQLELLKEKCTQIGQSVQTHLMDLSEEKKSMNEITEIMRKSVEEISGLMKHIAQNMRG